MATSFLLQNLAFLVWAPLQAQIQEEQVHTIDHNSYLISYKKHKVRPPNKENTKTLSKTLDTTP